MAGDNPFHAPTPADLPGGANEGSTLDAVPLEAGAVLSRCWELLQQHPGVVLGAVLLPAIPQLAAAIGLAVLDQLMQAARSEEELLTLLGVRMLVQLVTSFVGLYLGLGQARIVSRLARGLDAEVLMLFGEARTLPSAVVAWILMSFGIGVGFCLLVVPGLVLAIGWSFVFYAMVDQDLGPIDALGESWRLTDGAKLQVFVVGLILSLAGLAASCATLGLGFLLLVPLLTLTQGVMYHSLLVTRGPRPT